MELENIQKGVNIYICERWSEDDQVPYSVARHRMLAQAWNSLRNGLVQTASDEFSQSIKYLRFRELFYPAEIGTLFLLQSALIARGWCCLEANDIVGATLDFRCSDMAIEMLSSAGHRHNRREVVKELQSGSRDSSYDSRFQRFLVRMAHPHLQESDFRMPAYLLSTIGDLYGAIAACERDLLSDPTNGDAYLYQGCSAFKLGHFDESVENLCRAYKLRAHRTDIALFIADAEHNRNQFGAATEWCNYILESSDSPHALFSARLLRASSKVKMGDLPGAIKDLDHLVSIDPSNINACAKRALILNEWDGHTDALECISRLISICPNSSYAFQTRGFVRYCAGDRANAIKDYSKSLELASHSADTFMRRALALQAAGALHTARQDFAKACTLDLCDERAYEARGFSFRCLGEKEKAIEQYDLILSINAYGAGALIQKGETLLELALDQDALVQFSKALELNPCEPLALLDRSWLLFKMGRFHEAIVDCRALLKLFGYKHSFAGRAAACCALALRRIGDDSLAKDVLSQAVLSKESHWFSDTLRYLMGTVEPEQLFAKDLDFDRAALAHACVAINQLSADQYEQAQRHVNWLRGHAEILAIEAQVARVLR